MLVVNDPALAYSPAVNAFPLKPALLEHPHGSQIAIYDPSLESQ
tara:strand:+ start:541 stop:672 length:132 start_codon:yes stop_codon:yes gene_type:complete